jgi:anti-anti-sigma factor
MLEHAITRLSEEVLLVELAGSFTQAETDQIKDRVHELFEPGRSVIVDLSEVRAVTTPAVTLLMWGHRRAGELGGRLVLVATDGPVLDVLHRCRLDKVLSITGSQEAAMRACGLGG